MAWSRKKKTLLYAMFISISVYLAVQIVYVNESFSPLMVLQDAESEAQRLLKFITLYHYQCNTSVHIFNYTQWSLCMDGGLANLANHNKIAYSVGPSWDYTFEYFLSVNLSYTLFIFAHERLPLEMHHPNKTHLYKTIIVPNDPSDFGRNSYDSQTLNNIITTLGHKNIDILKLDQFADSTQAFEVLYYLIGDGVLNGVQQLHLSLYLDNDDDDYLYSWYRALYNLFDVAGFRLYHTSASDPLCLQVTMMESCIYYMSWIKNPGTRTFILHPPAIDGSARFEENRAVSYVTTLQTSCSNQKFIQLYRTPEDWEGVIMCHPEKNTAPCHIILIFDGDVEPNTAILSSTNCAIATIKLHQHSHPHSEPGFEVLEKSKKFQRVPDAQNLLILPELIEFLEKLPQIDFLYIDAHNALWDMLTPLLDSGVLQDVKQMAIDVALWDRPHNKNSITLRQRYSELRRLESQGLQIFYSSPFGTRELHFMKEDEIMENCCFQLSYLNHRSMLQVVK